MIEIMNMRQIKPSEPYDVRVDRQSVLGNPYPVNKVRSREVVCDMYKSWLKVHITKNYEIADELIHLDRLYRMHGKLRLFCWCAPLRCHAETIKEYLLHE